MFVGKSAEDVPMMHINAVSTVKDTMVVSWICGHASAQRRVNGYGLLMMQKCQKQYAKNDNESWKQMKKMMGQEQRLEARHCCLTIAFLFRRYLILQIGYSGSGRKRWYQQVARQRNDI